MYSIQWPGSQERRQPLVHVVLCVVGGWCILVVCIDGTATTGKATSSSSVVFHHLRLESMYLAIDIVLLRVLVVGCFVELI